VHRAALLIIIPWPCATAKHVAAAV